MHVVCVYSPLGVTFLPDMMVGSSKAGLCPSPLGNLTVLGTVPGTQQASINTSALEGGVCTP